ncbi:MAG: SAM-dependent methyltransferase [Arcobacteraceae bacterium]
MKFSTYFNDWLYGDKGYYTHYRTIGKEGDFYTSVSTSKFFGGSIGKKAIETIESGFLPNDTTIVEVGAHHGYLLADMIEFIYTLKPELLKTLTFAIVERFPKLQEQQKKYFKDSFGDEIKLVHYEDISQIKLDSALIVANEIFDAFGAELVYTTQEGLRKNAVVNNHELGFEVTADEYINTICNKYGIQKGEIALGYEDFANNLAQNIKKFEFITFDYGEKYPRNDFSMRIYHKHKVFPIFQEELPLIELFGKSDITYDVNFMHLIDSFKQAKIKNISYKTQLKALVEFGIIELLEILKQNTDETTYLREVQKVKTLLEPTGMGDRFKVAVFRKEFNA